MAVGRLGRGVIRSFLGKSRSTLVNDDEAWRIGLWSLFGALCLVACVGGCAAMWWVSDAARDVLTNLASLASVVSFLLAVVILVWTVLDSVLSKRSVDILEGVVPAVLHESSEFRDHATMLCEFLSPKRAGVPKHVTLVLSSLAYGILGRDAKDQPDPCAQVFLGLLRNWIDEWKGLTLLDSPPLLEICIWPQAKHVEHFGEIEMDRGRECLEELIDLLRQLADLVDSGKVSMHVSTLYCEVVRIFLVNSETARRCALVMMTQVPPDDGNRLNRYLLWQSDQSEAFEKFKGLVNAIRQDAKPFDITGVLRDPEAFVKEWFGYQKSVVH